jgi:hypothetical protein
VRVPPAAYLFDDPNTGRTPPGPFDRARPPRPTARVAYGEGTGAPTSGGAQPGTSGSSTPPPGSPGGPPAPADGCCP